MTTEIIDAETREVAVPQQQGMVTLFGTDDPEVVIERATRTAKALIKIVEAQQLFALISGKKHLEVEAWTLLGSMVGVFPSTVWTRPIKDGQKTVAWEARVEARTINGALVGSAETMCSREESRWKTADEHAIRSMAQTRGTSKALATPLRFIAVLAGFQGTPAAELPPDGITAQTIALFDGLKDTHDRERWRVLSDHGREKGQPVTQWLNEQPTDVVEKIHAELTALTNPPPKEPEEDFGPCPSCTQGRVWKRKNREGEVFLRCSLQRYRDNTTCQWRADGDAAISFMEAHEPTATVGVGA